MVIFFHALCVSDSDQNLHIMRGQKATRCVVMALNGAPNENTYLPRDQDLLPVRLGHILALPPDDGFDSV